MCVCVCACARARARARARVRVCVRVCMYVGARLFCDRMSAACLSVGVRLCFAWSCVGFV